MKHKVHTLITILRVAALGSTIGERLRLAAFLVLSKMRPSGELRRFRLRVLGRTADVWVRRSFSDLFMLHEAFIKKDYDAAFSRKEAKVIFDVGANVGLIAIYLKSLYPDARLYCFEPDPRNFEQLERNTAQFKGVRCFQAAIGARRERRTFYRSPVFHMRNSLIRQEDMDEQFDVEVISLSDAMQQADVSSVDLMKFDIEGAEADMFMEFAEFGKIKSIVGELHPHLLGDAAYKALCERLSGHYALSISGEGKKIFAHGTRP